MNTTDYWQECISEGADECGVTFGPGQLATIARTVEVAHDNYGMAFYSPPASDRIAVITGEWEAKYKSLQADFDAYKRNASEAVKQSLHLRRDDQVTIEEHGAVYRHGGRTEQIQ